MKKTKRIISMILAVIMLSMTAIGVNAEELITGTTDLLVDIGIIDPSPEEELMPMAASGCSDYYYYLRGMTMNDVLNEWKWTIDEENEIHDENGKVIGRYDEATETQEAHFHLYDQEGVHFILFE